jgi:hypothetical protein
MAGQADLAVAEEETWGVATDDLPYGLAYTRESLQMHQNSVDQEYDLSLGRGARPGIVTSLYVDGEVRGQLQPHGAWPLILKHAIGPVVTSGSSPYVHTMNGGDTLPQGLTIDKLFLLRGQAKDPSYTHSRRRFVGCMINRLSLNVDTAGDVGVRAGIYGRSESESLVNNPQASWPTNNDPYSAYETSISLDLAGVGNPVVTSTIRSFELVLENTLREETGPSSQYRQAIRPGRRKIGGRFTALFNYDTIDTWNQYWEKNTECQIVLTLSRGPYSMVFTLPSVRLRGTTPHTLRRVGVIPVSASFVAGHDSTLGTDIRLVITNSDPVLQTAA